MLTQRNSFHEIAISIMFGSICGLIVGYSFATEYPTHDLPTDIQLAVCEFKTSIYQEACPLQFMSLEQQFKPVDKMLEQYGSGKGKGNGR